MNHPPGVFYCPGAEYRHFPGTRPFTKQGLSSSSACHGAGLVTEQGVSQTRACHGEARVTDQRVSRSRACHGAGLSRSRACHRPARVKYALEWSARYEAERLKRQQAEEALQSAKQIAIDAQ